MSCCRRLLFQVHFLKLGSWSPSVRNFHSNLPLSEATSNSRQASSSVLLDRSNVQRPNSCAQSSPNVDVPDQKALENTSSSEEEMENQSIVQNLGRYQSMRFLERHQLNAIDTDWVSLLDEALSSNDAIAVSHLVADLVASPSRSGFDRTHIIYQYLTRVGTPLLGPDEVVLLLRAIATLPSAVQDIPVTVIARLAQWLRKVPTSQPHHSLLTDITQSLLASRLAQVKVPSGARLIGYRPPPIVHAAFLLIRSLSSMNERSTQLALNIFQTLIRKKLIPMASLHSTDRKINDFKYVITTALVRASLHWGWMRLATTLLEDLLEFGNESAHGQHLTSLVIDALYILLDTPSRSDVTAFKEVICMLHSRIPTAVVPDGLFRQFYNMAHELEMPFEAESVYALSRSPDIAKTRTYPPPQGPPLYWLMGFLTHVRQNEHLSRELVKQVTDDYEPIPLEFRAKFIGLVASSGFSKPARILWERYAIGKDKGAVLGNSTLMIRMVDLYYNLSRRAEDRTNIPRLSDATSPTNEEDTAFDRSSASLNAFTDRLLSAFVATHEPLEEAHHYTLTSLARAYFILGRFSEGFDALKHLLSRKEIPDLHDINVALSAMAENRPRAAAGVIERMIERGLRPTPVSFGTVIHYALAHGDKALVSELITRAHDFNDGQITLKSISSLIRASMRDDADSVDRMTTFQLTLDVLDALHKSGFTLSPSVGKHCVRASLEADEPAVAFKFWNLLLRHRTDWDNTEQRFLRRWIAKATRSHYFHGRMKEAQYRVILSQLRENRGLRRPR